MSASRVALVGLMLSLVACAAEWPKAAIPVCDEPGANCRCLLAGWSLCGDRCVNVQADRANCGLCGRACASRFCVAGACTDDCGSYPQCGDTCQLPDDPSNCGQCGHACGADEICAAGQCRPIPSCGFNEELCGAVCANLDSDENNCGACGRACAAHLRCDYGSCECSSSLDTDCGTYCADLSYDDDNCGSCGYACWGGSYCSSSYCH